jgi:hypothetical protein
MNENLQQLQDKGQTVITSCISKKKWEKQRVTSDIKMSPGISEQYAIMKCARIFMRSPSRLTDAVMIESGDRRMMKTKGRNVERRD